MFSEGQQELVLPADVCGQDERAQLLFHVLPAERRGRHLAKNTKVLLSDSTGTWSHFNDKAGIVEKHVFVLCLLC